MARRPRTDKILSYLYDPILPLVGVSVLILFFLFSVYMFSVAMEERNRIKCRYYTKELSNEK